MQYFYLEPEVAGGESDHSIVDRSVHPPIVSRLHYEFEGWLGDVLLEGFPCWIVTEAAKNEIQSASLSGVEFGEVEITKSELFEEMNPGRTLPRFAWLKVDGMAGCDDFGVAKNSTLVVSELALSLLQKLGIDHAVIANFDK